MKKQSLLLILLGLAFGSQIFAAYTDEEPTEETMDIEEGEEEGY